MPTVSPTPTSAPPDHATQPARDERGAGSRVKMAGSVWPTSLACGACASAAGNLQIWHSWWCGRNGDATSNDEIRCAACGLFTLYITEH